MLPLSRSQIDYTELPIGKLLDNMSLPPFQRCKNEHHANEMYENVKLYYETHRDVVFTGSISVGSYPEKNQYIVFDGQHRLHVLAKLRTTFPEIQMLTIRVDRYLINTEEEMYKLYNIINQNVPVQLFRGLMASCAAPAVEKWFTDKFGTYCKDSDKPTMLNINVKQTLKRMETFGLFQRMKATDLIESIQRLNTFYGSRTAEEWTRWGITIDEKRRQQLAKTTTPFYLGLFRHYEWVLRLEADPMAIEHCSSTVLAKKRDALPKKIKMEVWNKRYANQMTGQCYCCEEELTYQKGYHCGHIVSVHDGGLNEIDNLEVVCSTCNEDMGTMHMEMYKTLF